MTSDFWQHAFPHHSSHLQRCSSTTLCNLHDYFYKSLETSIVNSFCSCMPLQGKSAKRHALRSPRGASYMPSERQGVSTYRSTDQDLLWKAALPGTPPSEPNNQ